MQSFPRLLIALGEHLSSLEYVYTAYTTLLHDYKQVVLGIWVLSISIVDTLGPIVLHYMAIL